MYLRIKLCTYFKLSFNIEITILLLNKVLLAQVMLYSVEFWIFYPIFFPIPLSIHPLGHIIHYRFPSWISLKSIIKLCSFINGHSGLCWNRSVSNIPTCDLSLYFPLISLDPGLNN